MTITTKYNIGNTVWLINRTDYRLREFEISRIYAEYKKVEDASEEFHDIHIEYAIVDGLRESERHVINERDEGSKWWKTRDDAIAYITGKLVPIGDRHSMVQKARSMIQKEYGKGKTISNPCGLHPIKKKDAFEQFFDDSPQIKKNPDNHVEPSKPWPRKKKSELEEAFDKLFDDE